MDTGRILTLGLAGALLMGAFAVAYAQQEGHEQHNRQMHHASPANDDRQMVTFPEEMRRHTLMNMRDHLLTLQQIQEALGQGKFDAAADIAEERLGMTSLRLHGAHELAEYMPAAMQVMGSNMHHAASQFAVEAKNAGVTGDVKPVFSAYSSLMQQCVACHSSYRLQ